MKYNVNAVGREIPEYIEGFGELVPFKGVDAIKPEKKKAGAKLRMRVQQEKKIIETLEEAIKKSGLKDGMTISFHHHMRNGDAVVNMVLDTIAKMGIKDITLAPSSLGTCHEPVIGHIKSGVVTGIQSSGLRSPLGDEISKGILKKPVVIRSHGGRARAVEDGELHIDVTFLAAPSCDEMGNMNGRTGKSACGSLGYAKVDAQYADYVIAVTDNLVPFPNLPASIDQTMVDAVVVVESIGDPKKIVSGAVRETKNPRNLLIAKNAFDAMIYSGYFKDGFVYQTGAGGASLAVTKYLKEEMIKQGIKASLGIGGITGPLVDLHEQGLMDALFDTQSFDLDAARSIAVNPKHYEISASFYANPNTPGPAVNNLDFVMLGALEIDTDFNVNVMTKSNGVINEAVGGHQDTAVGAKMSVILAPLMRARIPIIVDKVTTVCTPGEAVDVICTDYGIVVNPRRQDLIDRFTKAGLNLKTIHEMKELAEKLTGKPEAIEFTDEIVGIVEYRDGSIIDVIKKIKE